MRTTRSTVVPVAHMALPGLGCLLGVLTVGFPWAVLGVGCALALVVWLAVVGSLTGKVTLTEGAVAAACISIAGAVYGYVVGLWIGNDCTPPMAAWMLAFASGLVAGMLARSSAGRVASLAKGLASDSDAVRAGDRTIAADAVLSAP